MSSNDKKNRFDTNCVCDVVKFINELQDAVTDNCPTGCDTPFLGANANAPFANTRPFLLYTKEGELFKAVAFQKTGQGHHDFVCVRSPIFRVESVDDCCAVLRVLVTNQEKYDPDHETIGEICDFLKGNEDLFATSSCITVDLNCFCAIQCLRDAHVRGI
jgi:hypothetical protein